MCAPRMLKPFRSGWVPMSYLEEPYVPHPLAGVMAQNKAANAGEKHVWSTGNQKI